MFKLNKNVLFQKLGNEAVLLNLSSEDYFGLDEVGSRMWEVLLEQKTIKTSLPILMAEFDVDEATLRTDLKELIEKLVTEKLILRED